jgi:hypothetical protein
MKNSKIIQEELKSLSENLAQLRANDAMKNMESSFVDKESDIMHVIQSASKSDDEFNGFSFSNDKLSYQSCYTVPENYFTSNEDAIIQKISGEHKKVKVISFQKVFSYAVAASVIILLGLSLFRYYGNKSQTETTSTDTAITKQIDSLPESELLSYLQDSGTDVEAALVASVSEEENLPSEDEILLNEDIFTNLNIQSSHQSENQKSSL